MSPNGVNSTMDALDNGQAFTGQWEENPYPSVMVALKTDQKGTLQMQFSPDGTNVDSSLSFVYDPNLINPPHKLLKGARFYRTVFTNDSGSTGPSQRMRIRW